MEGRAGGRGAPRRPLGRCSGAGTHSIGGGHACGSFFAAPVDDNKKGVQAGSGCQSIPRPASAFGRQLAGGWSAAVNASEIRLCLPPPT